MHKFTCTECPTQPFFAKFAPVFEDPYFCPCCGQADTTTYVGEVNQDTINQRFEEINDLMRKLYDIRKSPIKYALSDLSDWLEYDLDRALTMLDELQADVEESGK